ncbi:hypothetical protein [Paenarthrobacter sp. NPDC058040]|uniref:hypothetical protein n=1 Tax=unclassified Paenarthrobacter TaxID=2634190 RepID=UPI0036D75C16
MPTHERGQSGTVGTGAFDPERDDLAEGDGPVQQLPEPTGTGGHRQSAQDSADRIHDGCNVHLLVGVDADNDVPGS